jgi:hypothetical protein
MKNAFTMSIADAVQGDSGGNRAHRTPPGVKVSGLLGLAAVVGLLLPSLAHAQPPSPFTVETNIPGVYAYTQAPAGFNPLTASADELDHYGYPPRPGANAPAGALAKWTLVANPSLRRFVPRLRKTNIYHLPARNLKLDAKAGTATSLNWSGYVLVHTSSTSSPFVSVTGTWTVPTVRQPGNACSTTVDYSSEWVGIDGIDPHLLQAGSLADALCGEGEYAPWLEWLPAPEFVLETLNADGLPFNPGDTVNVTVTATDFSAGKSSTGKLVFTDLTENWQVSIAFTAAKLGGDFVQGVSAEWIVERTEVGGELANLPNYIADPWVGTEAADLANVVHTPGVPGAGTEAYDLTMLDNNKLPESFVDLFGADALWFFPEGSAK